MNVIDEVTSLINLLKYLREVVRLKSKTIYNISESNNYEEIIWFKDIPEEKECFLNVFQKKEQNNDEELIFKILRPKIIDAPLPTEPLKPWINGDYQDSSKQIDIKDRIKVKDINKDNLLDINDMDEEILLDENPEIFDLWCNYIDHKWNPWAKENNKLKKIQEIYNKLHSIYQVQKNLSETYEILIGFGLLNWQNSFNLNIQRHFLVANIKLELDTYTGTIVVTVDNDETRLRLEQDMLEVNERPSQAVQDIVEEKLQEISDIIGYEDEISEVLKRLINDMSSDGRFQREFELPNKFTIFPVVSLSPAFILRKRNETNYIRIYDDLIKKFNNNSNVPENINKILGFFPEKKSLDNQKEEPHNNSELLNIEDIFFPKDWNDKQIEIIDKLKTNNGILVQGPPGTGKSHTIANLICHLLAEGKKILITSHASRALKVLKNMLPEEIKPLVVNLLGQDKNSQDDLKESVEYIIDNQIHWDEKTKNKEIDFFSTKRYELRKKEAELKNKIRTIREKETYKHTICGGRYSGTAREIAQKIENSKEMYGWLYVDIQEDTPPTFLNSDMSNFMDSCSLLSEETKSELEKSFLTETELPNIKDFISAIQIEQNAKNLSKKNHELINFSNNEYYIFLAQYPESELIKLKENLKSLLMSQKNILNKYSYSWVPEAVNQILSEADRTWRTLFDCSTELLEGLLENAKSIDDLEIKITIKNPSFSQIKSDTEELLKYFIDVGGISFFTPKNIRKRKYIIKKIKINGKKVDSVSSLKKLLLFFEVNEKINKLHKHWNKFEEFNENQMYQYKIREIEDLCEPLSDSLELHSLINEISNTLKIKNIPHPCWNNQEDIENYIKLIESIECETKYLKSKEFFKKLYDVISPYLAKQNFHPIFNDLKIAINERDEKLYNHCYTKISDLNEKKKVLIKNNEILDKLSLLLPPIMDSFQQTYKNNFDLWQKRFNSFEEAWYWAQANTWLKKFISDNNEEKLSAELKAIQKRIKSVTANLTGLLALQHCILAINKNPAVCTYLREFVEATKRIGKGTGRKRAPKYRKIAKEKLQKCRPVIPAWIMPVFKVAETYSPETEKYDVVIIDEASQCSVDSTFLLCMAEKIIVVGDNEQISPEFYGINDDDITYLIEQYISNLPHKEFLGVDGSFYDLANIVFSQGHIHLNEHFRCVPEIIQFSNQLSYHNRLDMLRQFPPDRLEPAIKCIHVQDGFTEGYHNEINRAEAEKVVQTIINCCKDSRYIKHTPEGKKKMSMGVITLKGNKQDKLINQLLLNKLGSKEIEERNIICGNPYAFQGDERDVIFLSMVIDTKNGMTAQTSDKAKRRFNVAASRARDQMWLFHTPTLNDFRNKECYRYKLLEYCQKPKVQPIKGVRENCESKFEKEIYDLIVDRGYRVIPQYEMNGYRIDLMVEGLKGRLAVECDGDQWHGTPEQIEADERRQRQLERAGLEFWRVRGSEFYFDKENALESLWELLEKRKIYPNKVQNNDDSNNIIDLQSSFNNKAPFFETFSNSNEDTLFDNNDLSITEEKPINDENEFHEIEETDLTFKEISEYKFYPVITRDTDFYSESTAKLSELIISIVKVESPIHIEELTTRIRQCWDFKKAGKPIREKIKIALESTKRNNLIDVKENFLYSKDFKFDLFEFPIRKRNSIESPQNPTHIPQEEYISTAILNLKYYGDLSEDDLIKKIASTFGFKRVGQLLRRCISSAINFATKQGFIRKSQSNNYFFASLSDFDNMLISKDFKK